MMVNWIDVAAASAIAWGAIRGEMAYRRMRAKQHVGRAAGADGSLVAGYVKAGVDKHECAVCHDNVRDYAIMSDNSVRCLLHERD